MFCNSTLDPIKELPIVAPCKAIIDMPCDDADDMHPLTVDVVIHEDSIVSLATEETQVNKCRTQQLIPVICSLFQSVERRQKMAYQACPVLEAWRLAHVHIFMQHKKAHFASKLSTSQS